VIDFHSHILPRMDDGSDSLETSIKLIECLSLQGIDNLCLTSHFYPIEEDIDSFIKRRDISFNKLKDVYKGSIKLLRGAEVYYYKGISISEDIDRLCLDNSDFLLLELPFDKRIDLKELYSLNNAYSIVLAHIERYLDIYSVNDFMELHKRGIYLQVNAEVFNEKEYRKIKELFEGEYIDFIGSDTHNLDKRRPLMDECKGFLVEKYSQIYYDNFEKRVERIFLSRFK